MVQDFVHQQYTMIYWGYIGIMENEMETTPSLGCMGGSGLGFRET